MPSARGSTNWNFEAGESTTRCMLNDYQVSLPKRKFGFGCVYEVCGNRDLRQC